VVPVVSSKSCYVEGTSDLGLKEDSNIGNHLIEWHMSLELLELGRVYAVHPIFVNEANEVEPHLQTDWHLTMEGGVQSSQPTKALIYLEQAGVKCGEDAPRQRGHLGMESMSSLKQGRSVQQVSAGIRSLHGSESSAIEKAVQEIKEGVVMQEFLIESEGQSPKGNKISILSEAKAFFSTSESLSQISFQKCKKV